MLALGEARLATERPPEAVTQQLLSDAAGRLSRPGVDGVVAQAALAAEQFELARVALAPHREPLTADPDALVALAALSLVEGDLASAAAMAEAAALQAPDSPLPPAMQARIARARGEPEGALRGWRDAVARDPDAIAPRLALGALLSETGRADAAVEHLVLLADRFPGDARYALAVGEALLSADAPRRALGWAEEAVRRAPELPEAHLLIARAAIADDDLDRVRDSREAAFGEGDGQLDRRLRLAEAFAESGYPGLAEAEYAAALMAHGDSPQVWIANADWLQRRGQLDRAEGLIRQAIRRMPDVAELHAAVADIFERQDNKAGARMALAVASRLAPEPPVHEDELARVEFMDAEPEAAIGRWEALIAAHPSYSRARRRLAAAYRAMSMPERALPHLDALVRRNPHDGELRGRLGETLLASGQKEPAVGVLEAALANGADPVKVAPLLATALADVGRVPEAQRIFAEALAANPSNRPLRLTYAAFMEALGSTDRAVTLYREQLARDPRDIEALEGISRLLGPAAMAEAIETGAVGAAAGEPGLAVLAERAPVLGPEMQGVVLRDERLVSVDARGVAEIRHRRSILVHRPGGVERYGDTVIPFHAAHPPTVVRARTLLPSGRSVPVGPDDRSIRNPNDGTPLYGDSRELHLRFPRVEPGAIVDYEVVTHRPHPELPDAWWDAYVLGNADPTVQARYELSLPTGASLRFKAEGLPDPVEREAGGRRTLTWSRADLPAYRVDQPDDDPVPTVQVTNLTHWGAVDAWYHRLFHARSQPGPTVKNRVSELIDGVGDRRARIGAIYRSVERDVRYVGVEFGIGAYQPRPPESTLSRHEGDCKDMTALMVAMLAAIGVESYPALIRPRGQGSFSPDHPSPGQFSHVVLYVPQPDGDLWLDATAALGTIDAVPAALRGRFAFVVDGDGGRLMRVPRGRIDDHRLVESRTYELGATGGGRLTTELTLTGDLAGQARQRLSAVDADARRAILSAPGHLVDQGRVPDEVAVDGLDSPAAPLVLRASLRHADLVAVRLDGALVLPFDFRVFTDGPLPRYGSGQGLGVPRVFERRLRLVPPEGYRFRWSALDYSNEGPIAIEIDERRGGGEAIISARMRIRGGELDAAEQEMLALNAEAMRSAIERDLVMEPGPGFDRIRFLEAISTEQPQNPRFKVFLAEALLKARRPVEAALVLSEARSLDPDDERLALLSATADALAGTPEEMEKQLAETIRAGEASAVAYLALGALYTEGGRHDAAAEVLAKGARAYPDQPEFERAQVMVLRRGGRLSDARRVARQLVDRDPNDAEAWTQLGDVASAAEDDAAAAQAYREAVKLAPDDARLLNNLAWALRDSEDDRAEAIGLARKATALAPSRGALWHTLAELHARSEAFDAAIAALDRAIALGGPEIAMYRQRRAALVAQRARRTNEGSR